MKITNISIFFFVLTIPRNAILGSAADPHGHMQRLGSHRPPEKNIDETTELPSPEFFFTSYVQPGKPLLLKGAAKNTPAFNLWSDNYFSFKYGDVSVFAEDNKKENREDQGQDMTLKEFLLQYKHKDMYLVTDVPIEMYDEVMVPISVLCGGLHELLIRTVMWFSSGGTKSVLHFDELDNINCLLDGTKQLVLFSKNDSADILFDHFDGGYSSVDVEKVDMYKYSYLQNIPWYNVSMETGDCLFIPYKCAHQVVSSNTRNLAVNLWFSHLYRFNSTDCEMKPSLPNWLPITLVPPSPDIILLGKRGHILTAGEPYWPFTFENFMIIFKNIVSAEEVERIFTELDTNRDQLISVDEILDCELQRLADLFHFHDEDDSSEEDSEKITPLENMYDHSSHSEL